ncbi:hypothetical protein HA50_23440 [Pantoea cypripedii]|uniref:Uncharacterized protein n=1 Tax=Pantoea cypripedii TaxID=55209 RepID=A0A1X1EL57_PANCY|nr:hypothetical protein HA50_23440 [Pantoea cypripedii]
MVNNNCQGLKTPRNKHNNMKYNDLSKLQVRKPGVGGGMEQQHAGHRMRSKGAHDGALAK